MEEILEDLSLEEFHEKKIKLIEEKKTELAILEDLEWSRFAKIKLMVQNVPTADYLNIKDLLPICEEYKKLYDYLEAPTKEEVTALILPILHETSEYLKSKNKELLEDEKIRDLILNSVLHRTFETRRGNYNHFSKHINILRTKGYQYLELLLGKFDEEVIKECDLDITKEKISLDSYNRIINAINGGISTLIYWYLSIRNPEDYKKPAFEDSDTIYEEFDYLFYPLEGIAVNTYVNDSMVSDIFYDDTSLSPAEKHLKITL